jgi:chromate transport protein ChrA
MLLKYLLKNREKRKRFAHIGAGIVILIHSYEKYETGHDSYKLFALAGFIFLAIALFHPAIEKKAPWVDGIFFLIEGILSIIVAADFFHLGKKVLPVTYLVLALFQFFMAFKKSKKGIKHHQLNN